MNFFFAFGVGSLFSRYILAPIFINNMKAKNAVALEYAQFEEELVAEYKAHFRIPPINLKFNTLCNIFFANKVRNKSWIEIMKKIMNNDRANQYQESSSFLGSFLGGIEKLVRKIELYFVERTRLTVNSDPALLQKYHLLKRDKRNKEALDPIDTEKHEPYQCPVQRSTLFVVGAAHLYDLTHRFQKEGYQVQGLSF